MNAGRTEMQIELERNKLMKPFKNGNAKSLSSLLLQMGTPTSCQIQGRLVHYTKKIF